MVKIGLTAANGTLIASNVIPNAFNATRVMRVNFTVTSEMHKAWRDLLNRQSPHRILVHVNVSGSSGGAPCKVIPVFHTNNITNASGLAILMRGETAVNMYCDNQQHAIPRDARLPHVYFK